jgi:predicted RNA-binding protein associated with RNAse of E/G family
MSNNFRLTTTAALGLLLASVAAPIALADVPGYEFQDLDQQSSAVHSGITNRNADEALALARQALRDAQQAQQPMQHAVQQR